MHFSVSSAVINRLRSMSSNVIMFLLYYTVIVENESVLQIKYHMPLKNHGKIEHTEFCILIDNGSHFESTEWSSYDSANLFKNKMGTFYSLLATHSWKSDSNRTVIRSTASVGLPLMIAGFLQVTSTSLESLLL